MLYPVVLKWSIAHMEDYIPQIPSKSSTNFRYTPDYIADLKLVDI